MLFTNLKKSPTRRCSWRQSRHNELHAVPTQDSDAWRKLKTCPQSWNNTWIRQIFQVPSSTSPLAGKIVGMASCFRKELFSSCQNVFWIFEAQQLEVFAAQRWKRCRTGPLCKLTPSLVVLLHPAAIHLVDIAGKMQENNFFETYKLTARTWMYLDVHVFNVRFRQSLPCLDWRHKKGWRSHPPHNFIYVFKQINH